MVLPRCSPAAAALATTLLTVLVSGASVPVAHASATQTATLQDNGLLLSDPAATLDRLRKLGVTRVRVFFSWAAIAPNPTSRRRPRGLIARDPASYPSANWAPWDALVRAAAARNITIDFDLTGKVPLWATGPGAPAPVLSHLQWKPSAHEFGSFAYAVATRYSGDYDPSSGSLSPGNPNDLPPVNEWEVWNEPDYGPGLAPQGSHGLKVEYSPWLYRNLVDAAWGALQATGHNHDTFVFGNLAPRGTDHFGIFSGMKPLRFLRAMYCVDSAYRPLRGEAATQRGCPPSASGSRAFAGAHPALFNATGFGDHPYSQSSPPNVEASPDPDFTSLAELSQLERGLDRLQHVYHSGLRLPIYLTEYGYITSPPKHNTRKRRYLPPPVAAEYLNWAEYIAWKDRRVATLTQYLLVDPVPANSKDDWGGYASGLIFYDGRPKPSYYAYRLPIYLPVRSTHSPGRRLEVWGCARPAAYAFDDTGNDQSVTVQFQSGSRGPFKTLQTVPITTESGYFDVTQAFPGSGSVRLEWSYPNGFAVHSRTVSIRVR